MRARQALLGSLIVLFLAVAGGGALVVLWTQGPPGAGGGSGLTALEERVQALEDDVRRCLDRLDVGRSPREAARERARERDAAEPAAGGGGAVQERLAALDVRLEAIESRLRAQEEDPVLRGATYLASQDWRVRQEGIRLLKKLGPHDKQNLQAIRGMLDDPEPEVQKEALKALGEAGDREAMPRMVALLVDGAPGVREEAVESLADVLKEKGSEDDMALAAGQLLDRLVDADRDVREAAAEALGNLHVRAAVEPLSLSLQDPEEQVRQQALAALKRIKDPGALPALRALYAGGGAMDPVAVAAALRDLGDEQPFKQEVERLSRQARGGANARARWEAVKALATYGGSACRGILEEALQDPSPVVRKEAERALEKLKSS